MLTMRILPCRVGLPLLTLLDVMQQFDAAAFFQLAGRLGSLSELSAKFPGSRSEPVENPTKDRLIVQIDSEFIPLCNKTELFMAIEFLTRFKERLRETELPIGYPELAVFLRDFQWRIEDEMKTSTLFMRLERRKADYYRGSNLFGDDVARVFTTAALDIEESGKCYAAGRNTACVMHLMRVMEVGLRWLAKTVGAQDSVPSWDGILKKIHTELLRDHKDKLPDWKRDEAFFAEAATLLHAVKTAWRNPAMHVEHIYDDEKALEVFNAVKSFMRHLSSKGRSSMGQSSADA